MPMLPSGRHVGLSGDYVLAIAREGNLTLSIGFIIEVQSVEDLAPLLNIIYFKPIAGRSGLGAPYPSGLMLSDIGTEKCDWSAEDVTFFKNWLTSDVAQQWLQNFWDELAELIRTVKAPLPEALHGIMDDDD